jgi:hypothetical protein
MTVTLTGNCMKFATGETSNNCGEEWDVIGEPWCAGKAGLCGNWVDTGQTDMSAVTAAPATGYISDAAGYMDCQEVDVGSVLVFKLKDGSYAKVKVAAVTMGGTGCVDSITLQYIHPF